MVLLSYTTKNPISRKKKALADGSVRGLPFGRYPVAIRFRITRIMLHSSLLISTQKMCAASFPPAHFSNVGTFGVLDTHHVYGCFLKVNFQLMLKSVYFSYFYKSLGGEASALVCDSFAVDSPSGGMTLS